MPLRSNAAMGAYDVTLISALITSPVWVEWVNAISDVLSALTVLLALVLGVLRLYWAYKDRHKAQDDG